MFLGIIREVSLEKGDEGIISRFKYCHLFTLASTKLRFVYERYTVKLFFYVVIILQLMFN